MLHARGDVCLRAGRCNGYRHPLGEIADAFDRPGEDRHAVANEVKVRRALVVEPFGRGPVEVSLGKELLPIGIYRVAREDMFLEALLSPRLNWGGWEVDHSSPPADPDREAIQISRLRELADSAGLDPTFSEKFLRFIVDEVIRHHNASR